MDNIIEFNASESKTIKMRLPCKKESIKSFMNTSVVYFCGSEKYDLYVNDFISEAIKSLNNALDKALNNELQIKSEYIEKGIGYHHNIYSHELWAKDDLNIQDPAEAFIIWSTPSHIGIETYIYNIQNEIHIEISPIYKWNSDYPENENEFETFDDFINKYKVIDTIKINKEVALKWKESCSEVLKITFSNDKTE